MEAPPPVPLDRSEGRDLRTAGRGQGRGHEHGGKRGDLAAGDVKADPADGIKLLPTRAPWHCAPASPGPAAPIEFENALVRLAQRPAFRRRQPPPGRTIHRPEGEIPGRSRAPSKRGVPGHAASPPRALRPKWPPRTADRFRRRGGPAKIPANSAANRGLEARSSLTACPRSGSRLGVVDRGRRERRRNRGKTSFTTTRSKV